MDELSPIIALVITGILTPIIVGWFNMRYEVSMKRALAAIEQGQRDADAKREAARAEAQAERDERSEWRKMVEKRLAEQDRRLETVLEAQCTQMRSDAIHRAHRYIDDLGCASIEEKQSFFAEWEEYQRICEAYGITNSFVDNLVQQVMELPDRPRQNTTFDD